MRSPWKGGFPASPRAYKVTSLNPPDKQSAPQDLRSATPSLQLKKISESICPFRALKRVLRLTTKFVPTAPNLPPVSPRTCKLGPELFYRAQNLQKKRRKILCLSYPDSPLSRRSFSPEPKESPIAIPPPGHSYLRRALAGGDRPLLQSAVPT